MKKYRLLCSVACAVLLATSAAAASVPGRHSPYGQALLGYIRSNPHGLLRRPWIYGLLTGGQLKYYFIPSLCPDGSVDEFTIHDRTAQWRSMLATDAESAVNDRVVVKFSANIKRYDFSKHVVDLVSVGGFVISAPFSEGIPNRCWIAPNSSGMREFVYPTKATIYINSGVVPTSVAVAPSEARRIIDNGDRLTCIYTYHIASVTVGKGSIRNLWDPSFRVTTRPLTLKLRYRGRVLFFHQFK